MEQPIRRAEWPAALVVIAVAMFAGLQAVPFHQDESHWIGLSAPFEAFFGGRFTDPIWQTRQDRHTNAPITYYVVGAARRLGGWKPDALNAPYAFDQPYEKNVAEGRVPAPGLLWWSRAGVTAAAVLGLFGAFVLFARAAGRPAACLWLGLVLIHPYLRVTLRRAMNEGVLLAMLALVLWAAYRALAEADRWRISGDPKKTAAWIALAGIGAGLAAQTKANGGLALLGVMLLVAMATFRYSMEWRRRATCIMAAAAILIVACSVAYVATNPTLWPSPARGTLEMLRARTQILAAQMASYPGTAMPALSQRIQIASRRVFYDNALLPGTLSGIVLFAAGAWIGMRQLSSWLRRGHDNHALVAIIVVGGVVSLPAFLSPLDWPRYYLLPVFFCSFQIVLGMDWLARKIWVSLSQPEARR